MESVFFKKEWFKVSEYPSNIIPADAKEFSIHEDDCTVKGFYASNGDVHIQEINCANNISGAHVRVKTQ